MAHSCVNCQASFDKKTKGYKRQKLSKVLGQTPIYISLNQNYGISCSSNDFLCQTCFVNLRKATESDDAFVNAGKRKRKGQEQTPQEAICFSFLQLIVVGSCVFHYLLKHVEEE